MRSLPNILHVLPAFESGGVEAHVKELIEGAYNAYPTAKLFATSSGGRLANELVNEIPSFTHIALDLKTKSPLKIWRNIQKLRHIITEHKIDIVHVHSRAPAWSAYFACKQLKTPLVATYHGTYNQTNGFKLAYNAIMINSNYTIAISDFIAEHIRKTYKNIPAKLVTIHEGVDCGLFDPDLVTESDRQALRNTWNIDFFKKIILLPGRLTAWKGQKDLIEAMNVLSKPDCTVVFLGSAQGRLDYKKQLETLCEQYAIDARFIEHCPDMRTAYAVADVVVSTSTDPEAFGRITAEALAMNRRYVGTNHGGSIELTNNGMYGTLVAAHQPNLLADALRYTLNDETPAIASRSFIVDNYSLQPMLQKTFNLYNEIYDAHATHSDH